MTISLRLRDRSYTVSRLPLMTACDLWRTNPSLADSSYEVKSPVTFEALQLFLDAVQGATIELTAQNAPSLSLLCGEFGFHRFAAQIAAFAPPASADFEARARIAALEEEVLSHKRQLLRFASQITVLSTLVSPVPNRLSDFQRDLAQLKRDLPQTVVRFPELPLSPAGDGIFARLIGAQATPFDRRVIASQSSGDIHCLISADSPDNYSSGSREFEWVEFEFPEPIRVTAARLKSAHRAFLKTWAFCSFDDSGSKIVLHSAKNDAVLNGTGNEVVIGFAPTTARRFRIEKYGANWAGTNFFRLKNVELFSDEPRFADGVFRTLVAEAGDPHRARVYRREISTSIHFTGSIHNQQFVRCWIRIHCLGSKWSS
jgi:hypothetical protein